MTRAASCAIHGEFKRAFEYNRLAPIVLPLLGVVWLRALVAAMRRALALARG